MVGWLKDLSHEGIRAGLEPLVFFEWQEKRFFVQQKIL